MSGWIIVVVGALLCFAGVASVHLAVLVCGFGLAWLLADAFGASTGVALLVGLGGAVVAWVLVTLVLKTALFFVGGITGAVIGARLYTLLQPTGGNVVVAVVFVLAAAVLGGWLASRWSRHLLLWFTAIAGAGLLLSGLGRAVDGLAWLRAPTSSAQVAGAAALWVALVIVGWLVQRRVSSGRQDRSPTAR